jgi:hypothetical protein
MTLAKKMRERGIKTRTRGRIKGKYYGPKMLTRQQRRLDIQAAQAALEAERLEFQTSTLDYLMGDEDDY